MTTEHIVYDDGEDEIGADELATELGRLGAAARRRAERNVEERSSLRKRRRNARAGARVVERRLIDDEEVLIEEADQLVWILSSTELPDADEVPVTPPTQPTDVPDADEVPVTPPTQRVQPVPAPAADEPEAQQNPSIMERFRSLGCMCQILVLIAAFVGTLIGFRFGWWTADFGNRGGVVRDIFQGVWVFGLTLLGFGLGGFIAAVMCYHFSGGTVPEEE